MIKRKRLFGLHFSFLCLQESDRPIHGTGSPDYRRSRVPGSRVVKISVVTAGVRPCGEPSVAIPPIPRERGTLAPGAQQLSGMQSSLCDSVSRQAPSHLRQAAPFAAARVFPGRRGVHVQVRPRGRGRSCCRVRLSRCLSVITQGMVPGAGVPPPWLLAASRGPYEALRVCAQCGLLREPPEGTSRGLTGPGGRVGKTPGTNTGWRGWSEGEQLS